MRDPTSELSDRLTNGEAPVLDQPAPSIPPNFEDLGTSSPPIGMDVLVLTATPVERDAVLRRLRPLADRDRVLRAFLGAQTYYVGNIGSVSVALTMCRAGSQPRDGSLLATFEAIQQFHPRAVVAVGMAFGGYPAKLHIGDVLVSTHVIPYEPSRQQDGGGVHRGGEHDAGQLLLNRFREAAGWQFIRSDGYACRVHEGRILSGEKLVDSLASKTKLFADHQEAIGGEMEGSGIYAAAERNGITEWIVVKAVCDWADGTKHKQYQPLAAEAAASLLEHVFSPIGVLSGLPPFKPRGDQVATTGPSIDNKSYQDGIRNQLLVIRSEAARMEGHATSLNAGFYHNYWDQYISVKFNPLLLEGAFAQVLAAITHHSVLVSDLNELRSVAAAADSEIDRVFQRGALVVEQLRPLVLRVLNSASHVVSGVNRILGPTR